MLATRRECPETGTIKPSSEIWKDLQWLKPYAASSNRVSMIEKDTRLPINIFVDVCITSCGALCQAEGVKVCPQIRLGILTL